MNALRVIEVSDQRPSLALELPEQTSFDEWVTIGRRLCLSSQALNWHIGDWWAFGDHRYGERAKAAAEGLFGREFQTLVDLATVARRFESTRRRVDLSFTHHREVAALPPESAEELLTKAEREHLSTRDLRREVHALRAANDPAEGEVRAAQTAAPSAPEISVQSMRAVAIRFAEDVIELAEGIERLRKLTKRESDRLTEAQVFVSEARGKSKKGEVPEDFDTVFIEKGRVACEGHYEVARLTVNHWLIARGKRRLIDARAAFVSQQRSLGMVIEDEDQVPVVAIDERIYAIAKQAAHFLRVSRYGGWRVSPAPDGEWFVGTVRKSSDELISMAERQGFDSEAAKLSLRSDASQGVKV